LVKAFLSCISPEVPWQFPFVLASALALALFSQVLEPTLQRKFGLSTARSCIIHIGTHKTGTTSQQYFLMQHAQELLAQGLFFPTTGWYGVVPGHHGVAWELLWQDGGPILPQLLDEIRSSGAPAAILSAEDFSLLYAHPKALERLIDALLSIGYVPKILVYLRAQGPFAESIYVERIKHGDARPLETFLQEIEKHGYITMGESLRLQLRYTEMLAPFARLLGLENILVRPYLEGQDPSRVFSDFLESIGRLGGVLQRDVIELNITHSVVNESLSFIRLLGTLFTVLRPEENVSETAHEFAEKYAPDLPEEFFDRRFALLTRSDHLALLASVVGDNHTIESVYGARIPFTSDADITPTGDPIWRKAALERAIYDRCFKLWSEK
jgi:hypothetical protein